MQCSRLTLHLKTQGQCQGKSLEGVNLGGPGGRAPWLGVAPWIWCLVSAKIVLEALPYFLVKDDRKANFNTLDAWKYPTFSIFSFFNTFRGAFTPSSPPMVPPLLKQSQNIDKSITVLNLVHWTDKLQLNVKFCCKFQPEHHFYNVELKKQIRNNTKCTNFENID